MTKNEFKIGDTVRFKGKKKIHTITGINEYGQYKVSGHPTWFLSAEHLEHAETPDRKTAFLSELQALLRKYDATIYGGLSETHNDDVIFVSIGDDDIAYRNGCGEEYANITPDNIMDFDKE